MKRFVLVFVLLFIAQSFVFSQFSLIVNTYSQNFDGLGTTTSSGVTGGSLNNVNTSLNGWYFLETGSGSPNTEITAGTGSDSQGDTYNFGAITNANRKLGGLQSGTLNPTIGFYFTNNTLITITDLAINYTGETWRVGSANRSDKLDFQYSTDATLLSNGSWTDIDLLDYANPGQATGNGTIQHSASITSTISGLNIQIGATFFIRWNDFNASGGDDGMALEDFSFTASYVPPSTDYFRSAQTGNWNTVTTWESSPDNISWGTATATPTSAANTIQIRNTHIVTINSSTSADQLVIESGGVLDYTAGTFTLNDGAGDDIDIQSGGVFVLSQAATPPTYGTGSPTINVNTGGIVRVSASGLTFAGTGVNANNFVYGHQSVLDYTLTGSFGVSGVTYFPNVNATTIPIFRITINSPTILSVGAGTFTRFNGVFEANGTGIIRWTNAGDKIFRNGVINECTIDYNAGNIGIAKFIIDGETATLGGSGSLLVPPSTLQIGSASNNTTVTVANDKTVTGNISLLSTNNTYVDLGANDLTVTGTVTNGTATSYIRTASTGALILNSVDVAGKNFPVGHTKYNPILIENGSGYSWTVNVNDGVIADPPQGITGAVLLTWNITPSTNPPSAGADITFQFDRVTQTGPLFNVFPHNFPDNIQPWHRKLGWWLASGSPVNVNTVSGNIASAQGLGLVDFSPYGLARVSLPLPIKLLSFSATKISSGLAIINWELSACCSKDALFELEKSTDSRNFTLASSINGSETNKFYFYNDSRLGKGISYYRLKMTDTDGSVKYSKVIAIVNEEKGFVITSIAPNPVQHTASLTISAAKQSNVDFKVYDMTGNLVKQWQSTVASGINVVNMDVSALANGTYHVLASSADDKAVIRFIKQ